MYVKLTGRVPMMGRRLHVPNVGSRKVEIICFGSLNERQVVRSKQAGRANDTRKFGKETFRCKFILIQNDTQKCQ